MTLSCHDPSDSIPFVSKIRQDKNMTNHTGAIYDKNDIKLLWPIRSSVTVTTTRQHNDMTNLIGMVYAENKT